MPGYRKSLSAGYWSSYVARLGLPDVLVPLLAPVLLEPFPALAADPAARQAQCLETYPS